MNKRKKLPKRHLFKIAAGLCFLFMFSGQEQIRPKERLRTQETTTCYIEHTGYIKQKYTLNRAGFIRTEFENHTGKKMTFSAPESLPEDSRSIPAAYDLRNKHKVTSVKNQKNTGCCWAFSTLKSLESNLLMTGKGKISSLDLSENHLAWFLYHPAVGKKDSTYRDGILFRKTAARKEYKKKSASFRKKYSFQTYYDTLPYRNGGNALFGASVLARWSGAVLEKKAPFSASTNQNIAQMGTRMHLASEKLRYTSDYMLTDAVCYDEAEADSIKEAIMQYGAMEVSFYYNKSCLSTTSSGTCSYFQKKHVENAGTYANHCVTIIGWDDNCPKENFLTNTPENNGAWLVANSYGSDFGENGYFWISYEEPSFVDFYSFRGNKKIYDHNYQYDGSGWTIALAPQKSLEQKAANIFTATVNYTQNLKAVAFYTAANDQPYTISVYRNVKKSRPESGEKMLTVTGTQKYRGYHTVALPKDIFLKAGQRFSIVLSLKHTTEKNGYLPLEGTKLENSTLSMNFSSRDGESFYYACVQNEKTGKTGYTWADLNRTTIRTSADPNGSIYHNACIKAFTKNVRYAGKIRFSTHKLILKKGQKKKIRLTIKKSPDKTVTYTNSKKEIASCSKAGIITAKKKGKTILTATLSSGAHDRLTILVK